MFSYIRAKPISIILARMLYLQMLTFKFVNEISNNNAKDVTCFCNVYIDMDFQVLGFTSILPKRYVFLLHMKK